MQVVEVLSEVNPHVTNSQLTTQQSSNIVYWMNDVEERAKAIIEAIPLMRDEELQIIHDQADVLGRCSWMIQAVARKEILSRAAKVLRGRGKKDIEEQGATAMTRKLAKQIGVTPREILDDASIVSTFFENSGSATTILEEFGTSDHLLDKDYFRAAIRSEDPHATLEHFARQKANNPNFTTRDAWRYVKEQKTPSIDSTVPPLIEDDSIRTWYESFVNVLERAPEMAGLKRLLNNILDEIRNYVQRPTTSRRNQILDLIREAVDEVDLLAHELGTDRIHVAVWLNKLCEDDVLVAFEKEQRDGARGQRRTGYRIVGSGEK